jgi:hypothetical protein
MASTCPEYSTFTSTQLIATYSEGILRSFDENDRDSKGIPTAEAVKTKVQSLRLPVLTPNKEDKYMIDIDKFIVKVKEEYCFYYSRYSYSLHKLIGAISDSYANKSSDTAATINTYREHAKKLNQKVNDLTLIINGVAKQMLKQSDILAQEIAEFNEKISGQRTRLEEQNQIITTNESSTKIKQQMVKYTEEKARHTDKLLQLYSFMNIIAVGLLIYIYKAAE